MSNPRATSAATTNDITKKVIQSRLSQIALPEEEHVKEVISNLEKICTLYKVALPLACSKDKTNKKWVAYQNFLNEQREKKNAELLNSVQGSSNGIHKEEKKADDPSKKIEDFPKSLTEWVQHIADTLSKLLLPKGNAALIDNRNIPLASAAIKFLPWVADYINKLHQDKQLLELPAGVEFLSSLDTTKKD